MQHPVRGVDGRVLRDANLRTPSGPEGSSGKQALAGAAGVPDRSHRPGEAPEFLVRRRRVRGHPRSHRSLSAPPPAGRFARGTAAA